MFDTEDNPNFLIAIVLAIIAAVVAGVITLAVSRGLPKPAAASATAATVAAPVADAAGVERLYFEVGSVDLPADAAAVLARVADAARAGTQAVLVSGFHDESGDPAQNAELAKNRAAAVKHALEANGVASDRVIMSKPEVAAGGADPREARRVELRLQ